MKKSMILSVVLAFVTTLCSYAQLNVGVDSYYLGDYEKAEELIKKSMAENPEMANYYLGEIAFSKGDVSGAESFYNEGLRVNAESVFNKIGLMSVKLKSNAPGAENELTGIAKKNKKDVDVMLAIGYAYLKNGMTEQAMKQVDEAKKINNKKPEIYILEGDVVAAESKSGKAKGKAGEAAGKYEMAAYFSPDYLLAYMKVAQFYEYINPMLAIEKLRTVIEKQLDYIPAYGYLGKLYTQQGFYPEAIAAFSTYFKAGIYTVEDIERYARAYYFTDNYPEAEKLVVEGLGRNPKHFVLNRYKMYIADKIKNADQGMLTANYFFSLRSDTGYIAKDYSVFASILNQNKKYEEAFVQYNKAISRESANLDLYSEAASMAREDKHYAIAALYLKKQMEEKSKLSGDSGYQDDIVDISTLGYDYYSAGVSISKNELLTEKLMNNKEVVNELLTSNANIIADSMSHLNYFSKIYSLYYLTKADSVFDILISRASDSYSGYRYKALTKHAITPEIESGLAKPYYEKVIEIITKSKDEFSTSEKRVLLEAYNYLGYYYYMKSDKENTISLWTKVLELDPDNKNAKLVLEDMAKK